SAEEIHYLWQNVGPPFHNQQALHAASDGQISTANPVLQSLRSLTQNDRPCLRGQLHREFQAANRESTHDLLPSPRRYQRKIARGQIAARGRPAVHRVFVRHSYFFEAQPKLAEHTAPVPFLAMP